jgi:hypothetical protein
MRIGKISVELIETNGAIDSMNKSLKMNRRALGATYDKKRGKLSKFGGM